MKMINKKKYYKYIFFILGIGINSVSHAKSCEQLDNVYDVLGCAVLNHPEVKVKEISEKISESQKNEASRLMNPEFNNRSLWSSKDKASDFSTEINLTQTIELGSKRKSRIERAEGEINIAKIDTLKAKEDVYLNTLLALFKLKHLGNEKIIVKDALDTFSKMQKLYKSRSNLTPEQLANLKLFEIADNDYKMRLLSLESDYELMIKHIQFALNQPFSSMKNLLPKENISWPEIQDENSKNFQNNNELKEINEKLKIAKADLGLVNTSGWNELKIGPSVELQKDQNGTVAAYGFNITLPIPVFNQNNSIKTSYNLEIEKQKYLAEKISNEVSKENAFLIEKYKKIKKVLREMSSKEEISRKHQDIENLFVRGLVTGSLLVEIHRQVYEFTVNYNENEIMAAEVLTRIYRSQGKFPEENLW